MAFKNKKYKKVSVPGLSAQALKPMPQVLLPPMGTQGRPLPMSFLGFPVHSRLDPHILIRRAECQAAFCACTVFRFMKQSGPRPGALPVGGCLGATWAAAMGHSRCGCTVCFSLDLF